MAIDQKVDHCCMADIGLELAGEDAPPMIAAINEYLAMFAKPVPRDDTDSDFLVGKYVCLKCEKTLAGAFGAFQWGLANGEGACGECGWPARGHHRPTLDGAEIFDRVLEVVLQYHPEFVITRTDGEDE